jgi:hypothetical protein
MKQNTQAEGKEILDPDKKVREEGSRLELIKAGCLRSRIPKSQAGERKILDSDTALAGVMDKYVDEYWLVGRNGDTF